MRIGTALLMTRGGRPAADGTATPPLTSLALVVSSRELLVLEQAACIVVVLAVAVVVVLQPLLH